MSSDSSSLERTALSVSLAVGAYGAAFGAAAVAAGLSPWQASVLSLAAFTGSSQFAAVAVVASGGSGASAVGAASLLGVRNGLYALRLSTLLDLRGWRRLAGALVTIDESTAVALAFEHEGPTRARRAFWLTGWGVYLFWNLFTVLGAVAIGAFGSPASLGLDAAVPAAFLALVWPRVNATKPRVVAAVACLLALATTPSLPLGLPLLVAAAVAVLAGWRE